MINLTTFDSYNTPVTIQIPFLAAGDNALPECLGVYRNRNDLASEIYKLLHHERKIEIEPA